MKKDKKYWLKFGLIFLITYLSILGILGSNIPALVFGVIICVSGAVAGWIYGKVKE